MIVAALLWFALVAAAGVALVDAWLPRRAATDALERGVLAIGLGYGWAVVAGLALNAAPWGLDGRGFVAATLLLIGAIVVVRMRARRDRRPVDAPPAPAPPARALDRRAWLAVAAVLAFAALYRLPNLGWSEFQGDEALVLHKAAATIDGRHDAIFVHKKGPAEILVTAEVYALTRRIDERAARLPFALAMLSGLAALVVVGRGLFAGARGTAVGVAAAAILSLNGFFVAFGRVVQYQALVFLFGTLALWCAWRYRHADDDDGHGRSSGRWLVLCAVFLACGLLSHYDAGLVAPAIGYLVVARWRAVPGALRRERWAVAASFALGTALLASFYVPLVRHPYFQSTTLRYLVDVRLGGGGGDGGGAPYNAIPKWAGLANFYSSAPFLLAIGLLVAAAVTMRLVARWPRAGWAAAALAALAVPALVLRPEWLALTDDVEGRSWAIAVVAALVVAPLVAGRRDAAWTTVWLWFAAPFVFYATLVESPRTHFHVVFPALSLLAALALPAIATTLHPSPSIGGGVGEQSSPGAGAWGRRRATLLATLLGAVALHAAYYDAQVFLRHDIAYKRAWPEVRVPLAWYPFDDLPSSGWFGFPYRAGWKAVGVTLHTLGGDYDSNEEPAITAWYTRGAPRCGNKPTHVVIASHVQDPQPVLDPDADEAPDAPPSDEDLRRAGYDQSWRFGADSPDGAGLWEPALRPLAQRYVGMDGVGSSDGVELLRLRASSDRTMDFRLPDDFDSRWTSPRYDGGLPFNRPARLVDAHRADPFGEPATIRLDGWRWDAVAFDSGSARDHLGGTVGAWPVGDIVTALAGDRLILTLAWTPLAPLPPNAQVFVHLEREGERTIGQDDGPIRTPVETVCGEPRPLSSLAVGEAVLDRRVIDIAPDAPPGDYDLLVGIYDYETGERLPVTAGPDAGQSRVRLTTVQVVE